jgi:cytochrome c553
MRRPAAGLRRMLRASCGAAVLMLVADASGGAAAQAAGDREFGQYLSSECVTCHQASGQYQGIPPIVGWPERSFIEVMHEYKSKKRDNPVMQTIAGKLSDEEIAALAAYFASLGPQPR